MDIELLSKLADQGVLGILLAVSVAGNVMLIRMLINSYEDRLVDAKEYKDTTMQVLSSIKQTADVTLTSLQTLVAAAGGAK